MDAAPECEAADRRAARWAWLWLLYLVYPVWQIATTRLPPGRATEALGLLAAYAGFYVAYWWRAYGVRNRPGWPVAARWGYVAVTVAVAGVEAAVLRSPDTIQFAVYAAPAVALEPGRRGFGVGLAVLLALTAVLLALFRAGPDAYLAGLVPTFTVAVGARGIYELVSTQRALARARADIEALSAANERLRISRDLHDILGHSLSAIAVRAELARAQALDAAPEAAEEMGRVAHLARQALTEVRAMVAGFRGTTLREEWQRLAELFGYAGIAASATWPERMPPAPMERALALVLREAGTNVLRHSGARRCEVRLEADPSGFELAVRDDGRGGPIVPGHGLRGVSERLSEFGGTVTWSTPPGGGLELKARIRLHPAEESSA